MCAWKLFLTPADGELYLSASPQEAEQVSVLQLLHDCHQWSPERNHTEKFWQEGMRSQLGQEGCKVEEAVSLGGVGRIWTQAAENSPVTKTGRCDKPGNPGRGRLLTI